MGQGREEGREEGRERCWGLKEGRGERREDEYVFFSTLLLLCTFRRTVEVEQLFAIESNIVHTY